MTKEERLRKQRITRKTNGNLYTNRYEKTVNGFLMRKYRNMKSRVNGVQWKKAHLYKGKYLLPREIFYLWSILDKNFWYLFITWTAEGYPRKLTPSIDRINPKKGYEITNIQWITHAENSAKVLRVPSSSDALPTSCIY